MNRRRLLLCCVSLMGFWSTGPAFGQMFGDRDLGRPLSIQDAPTAIETAGELTGGERFLRRNRPATAFVGPDLRDLERFIGSIQARVRGRVQPTTEGLRRRVDRSADINQPLPPVPAGTLYNPKVAIGFSEIEFTPSAVEDQILDLLAGSGRIPGSTRVEVLVADRTAILRGEVLDARDRELIQLMVSFEPGIEDIQNELVVNPELRPGPGSLAARQAAEQRASAWVTLSHGGTPPRSPPASPREE